MFHELCQSEIGLEIFLGCEDIHDLQDVGKCLIEPQLGVDYRMDGNAVHLYRHEQSLPRHLTADNQ